MTLRELGYEIDQSIYIVADNIANIEVESILNVVFIVIGIWIFHVVFKTLEKESEK